MFLGIGAEKGDSQSAIFVTKDQSYLRNYASKNSRKKHTIGVA